MLSSGSSSSRRRAQCLSSGGGRGYGIDQREVAPKWWPLHLHGMGDSQTWTVSNPPTKHSLRANGAANGPVAEGATTLDRVAPGCRRPREATSIGRNSSGALRAGRPRACGYEIRAAGAPKPHRWTRLATDESTLRLREHFNDFARDRFHIHSNSAQHVTLTRGWRDRHRSAGAMDRHARLPDYRFAAHVHGSDRRGVHRLPEGRGRRGEASHAHPAGMSLGSSAERGDWVEELLGSPAMALCIKVEAVTLQRTWLHAAHSRHG